MFLGNVREKSAVILQVFMLLLAVVATVLSGEMVSVNQLAVQLLHVMIKT